MTGSSDNRNPDFRIGAPTRTIPSGASKLSTRPAPSTLVALFLALLPLACTNRDDTEPEPPPSMPRGTLPAELDLDRPLKAAFLIVDGVYNSELMAPYDVFHHTPFHTSPRPGIEVFTVSPNGQPVTTFEGLVLHPHHSFASAPEVDILVVPSAEHSMDRDLENEELISWVRQTGERASFVVSLCDGAFVLAAAGLLDGRAATTFPSDQDRFAEQFPHLDLRRGVSFVHDGKALTSVGGAQSYDVAMYLVDLLYGESVAAGVGGGLLISWPPNDVAAAVMAGS